MSQRIRQHPILDFKRQRPVRIFLDGREIEAYEGETVVAALYASGIKVYSHSIKYGRPRGFFCGIGKCSSCLMRVNGMPHVRTCITLVEEGMKVEYEKDRGELPEDRESEVTRESVETDLVVVGGGPAGLSSAIAASNMGLETYLLDENPKLGGQLIKQTHKFFGSKSTYAGIRGIEIAKTLLGELQGAKVNWMLNTSVVAHYKQGKKHLLAAVRDNRELVEINAENIVVATGARENMLLFPNNDLPGIYGAGGVQTLMNVYGIKPGDNALIVGAGNVGLIVGYQLIQAGVDVKMVIEALPNIGGYLVHASKLRRMGVPILTRHTIKEAHGKDHVESVTIVELDRDWQPIEGTEQKIDTDLVCLAVGLTPSSELLFQAGCEQAYIPELGGQVAVHNENLETTVEGIYVAGDVSGIGEANTALVEGRLSAANVAMERGKNLAKAEKIRQMCLQDLAALRSSPFSKKVLSGKKKIWEMWEATK
ncbi:MAG: FAD-dependent oxidoreductase [Candidatus Bathycorpusculaceae bacterium]